MSNAMQIKLSSNHAGRIILHLICAKRDRKIKWHLKNILREIL